MTPKINKTYIASDYNSETIPDLIAELKDRGEVEGYTSEMIEAIATHIIMTDTDYDLFELEAQNEEQN